MRTAKSIKNVTVMLLTQCVTLGLAFAVRTIFIKTLGAEYLGLNGLFCNILNALSLAEMGIGTAISVALYKPISENNIEQIKSLLAFYKKCYFAIGIFIIMVGCFLIPFLPYLIKSKITVPINLNYVYLSFLANSAIGYFFAHKRIIIDITQNKYLTNIIDFTVKTVISAAQIFILVKFQNYMAFLYVQIAGTLIGSFVIWVFADKRFPYIKENATLLSVEAKQKIWKDISILFFHKFGTIAVFGTDFILISALVGIADVGIYSNYTLIINTVAIFIGLFMTGADASIGNAITTLKKNELYAVFKKMSFLIFCISGISSVLLLNLLNAFVELWAGENYTLPYSVVIVLTVNFFLTQNRFLVLNFKYNAGLFRPDMYKPLIEVVFNLGISIILAKHYGVLGIVIGTLANTFFVCIWVEAYLTHKHIFKNSVLQYVKMYIFQIAVLLIAYFLSYCINSYINSFVLKILVSVSVSVSVYFIFFFRTEEFRYFMKLTKEIAGRALNNNK